MMNLLYASSRVAFAAMIHDPQTLLQWIIATADRAASGFEREEFEKYNSNNGNPKEIAETGKNFLQARMLTLFKQISTKLRIIYIM